MSTEAMRELKTLASVCPELNMANYGEDDVRHLNDWAIEMSLLAEKVAAAQQPAQATQAEVTDDGLISKDRFYGDDHVQDIAHALAQECEQAELDPNDLVTVNRAKLVAIAARVLEKARAILALRPERAQMTGEQWTDVLGSAGPDLLDLAKQWSDNKVHVYQVVNEAEKIVKAAVLRGITAQAKKETP